MVEYDAAVARDTDRTYQTPDIIKQRMRTIDALSLSNGDQVLDVGCGTGLLAHDMSSLVGPDGGILGVDLSADMLALAAQRCQGLDHVAFKSGDAENLPVESESFDALTCVQVLLYVVDVPKALREMRRVLRPGGRVAIIETDWRGAVLSSANDALTRRILQAWDDSVPSPHLPTRLGKLLGEEGFLMTRVEAIPIINTSRAPGGFSVDMTRELAGYAIERGAISESEKNAWLEDLRAKSDDGAYFFCVNRFLFAAVRL